MMGAARTFLLIVLVMAPGLVPGQSKIGYASSPNPQRVFSQRSDHMKINMNIGGKTLTATLADNATARDFVSVLPLSVSMKDLFGREKYSDLPKPLSESGPRTNTYQGDIAYWSPDHQFAVYYHQDGGSIPSPGVIPIAKIDAGVEAFNVTGAVYVTIAAAK
jgi:hypothetical protein